MKKRFKNPCAPCATRLCAQIVPEITGQTTRRIDLFDSGVGITEIALELGRTEPAVYQQIEKLDLYGRKQNPQRQRNGKKPPECLCGRCGNDPALCPLRKQCTAKKEN